MESGGATGLEAPSAFPKALLFPLSAQPSPMSTDVGFLHYLDKWMDESKEKPKDGGSVNNVEVEESISYSNSSTLSV